MAATSPGLVMAIATGIAHRRWTQSDITALRSGILAGHGSGALEKLLDREGTDLSRMAARLNLTFSTVQAG